jgi:hypothetical protein
MYLDSYNSDYISYFFPNNICLEKSDESSSNGSFFKKQENEIKLENGNKNEIDNLETINKNKEKQKNNPVNFLPNTSFTSRINMNNAKKKKDEKKGTFFKIGKQGRNRKNKTITKKNQHSKFEKNNIIIKIKRRAFNFSLRLINKMLKKSENEDIKKIKLKKIKNSIIAVCEKQQNLDLLETKLKDLLSNDISPKYTKKENKANFNKIQIDIILEKGEPELKEVLNKTFYDMINLYVQEKDENNLNVQEKDENTLYKDIGNIEDDKKKIISLYESDGEVYFDRYKEIAKELKQIILEKKARKKNNIKNSVKNFSDLSK